MDSKDSAPPPSSQQETSATATTAQRPDVVSVASERSRGKTKDNSGKTIISVSTGDNSVSLLHKN